MAPIRKYHRRCGTKVPDGGTTCVGPGWGLSFPMGLGLVAVISWRLLASALQNHGIIGHTSVVGSALAWPLHGSFNEVEIYNLAGHGKCPFSMNSDGSTFSPTVGFLPTSKLIAIIRPVACAVLCHILPLQTSPFPIFQPPPTPSGNAVHEVCGLRHNIPLAHRLHHEKEPASIFGHALQCIGKEMGIRGNQPVKKRGKEEQGRPGFRFGGGGGGGSIEPSGRTPRQRAQLTGPPKSYRD